MTAILYLIFFLSGAAALIYEVVWLRALILVFGGSHLAVTAVLSVFMGGLALGGWLIGRRVDRLPRPLRTYGLLELGIAASALLFVLLVAIYPALYVPLARLGETSPVWLTVVRAAFSFAAMIVPTTLMGGTLPVLSRFASAGEVRLGGHLAFLYGFNTLGAVAGSLAAGFVLLPALGANRTLAVAVATNVLVGLIALGAAGRSPATRADEEASVGPAAPRAPLGLPGALVLTGIGLSGFCALGYEVLWTRVLSMVVGTSVYSFTIMLVAFLAGIGLGSQVLALLPARWRDPVSGGRVPGAIFAATQVIIGIAALATTWGLRALPAHATSLQRALASDAAEFAARQGTSFVLAFAYMAVPALFMGVAFPLAGNLHAARRGAVGRAVGEVLAANTVGAILGAAASGFALVYLFGIERSLQMLATVNVGLGLALAGAAVARRGARIPVAAALVVTLAALLVLASDPPWARLWDRKFFAVFRNNQREAFDTPERIRDALENTDVLYYHEGINETISVIRPKGGSQAFIVNGRSEATTLPEDIQCQRTLGHLPMLLHPNPRRVFVLGLGTGMTLGATSIHPEVETLTLAEIEAGVFGAARTFADFNHRVLDHPKLRVIHDDGRNVLRTTSETFDVITADPIHPWSGGASYLYTTEYFRTVARRLRPGGVACQWLPIYELTADDLKCVVRTFCENFRYTALWLTYYDAELVGSNDPLVLDEAALARRFADPDVARDLAAVDMGSPRDFLSYMLAGDAGVRAFARGGRINTDDNLWLEFSSPRSQGVHALVGANIEALAAHRENPLAYLATAGTDGRSFWTLRHEVGPRYDRAHALALWNRFDDPEMDELVAGLRRDVPDHAPARFLERRRAIETAATPRPIAAVPFAVTEDNGRDGILEITAVAMRTGRDRAVVVFVDNARREVYAQRYLDAPDVELDGRLSEVARRVLDALRGEYETLGRGTPPPRAVAAARLKARAEAAAASAPGD